MKKVIVLSNIFIFTYLFSFAQNISGRWYSDSKGVFDVENLGGGSIRVKNANNFYINYTCDYNSYLRKYECDNGLTISPSGSTCTVRSPGEVNIWTRNNNNNDIFFIPPSPSPSPRPVRQGTNNVIVNPVIVNPPANNQQNNAPLYINRTPTNQNNSFNRQQPSGVTNGPGRGNNNSGVSPSHGRGNSIGTANPASGNGGRKR